MSYRLSRNKAMLAKDVCIASYQKPQFEYENDQFYIQPDHKRQEIHIGVTGSNDKSDWWDNFLAFKKFYEDFGVVAHKRWFERALAFEEYLTNKIYEAADIEKAYDVFIYGHSYGGAAAQNYTLISGIPKACVTFNSPQPWREFRDEKTESAMRNKIFHFRNEADTVTKVPFRNNCFGREYVMRVNQRGIDHDIELNQTIIDWYFRK